MSWTWRYFGGDFPNNYKGICLNTDFRVWLLYERYMRNPDIIETVKAASSAKHCLSNYKVDWSATTLVDCIIAMQWFYDCGNDAAPSGAKPTEKMVEILTKDIGPDAYSYYYDVRHIWGAFMSAYSIDLFKENMHWWKFRTLFDNLPNSNTLGHLKHIRTIKKDDVVNIEKGPGRTKQVKEWEKVLAQKILTKLPEY